MAALTGQIGSGDITAHKTQVGLKERVLVTQVPAIGRPVLVPYSIVSATHGRVVLRIEGAN